MSVSLRSASLQPRCQSVSCRTPKCDRNATCATSSHRSLQTPYGCCSDYMMLMLADVTGWLHEQNIPYFITYGTLLGAVRENDILPWTQDMDIVIDRRHWPELQRGLEAAEFFGGRRYLFGVDQWEEKVSRVCADWEGFASSIIGGQEGDRFSRPADFHLDVYASDWWQITDLHLVDCVEPLGSTNLQIRGRNFSAPARPRACVEKLYGAEWRIPKKALAGVN
ncbi:ADO2 [Symbiodinium pilosum]|uniref:ADO2 protein n=1 Tax=Symbiodinium pilosum TaxID=2952 RepID=A0A812Y8W5_SYMPI|nr:ADO2 [Symbiodinium pilosum]